MLWTLDCVPLQVGGVANRVHILCEAGARSSRRIVEPRITAIETKTGANRSAEYIEPNNQNRIPGSQGRVPSALYIDQRTKPLAE